MYHRERLGHKEYAIIEAINYYMQERNLTGQNDSMVVQAFDTKVCELANINGMDINIFDLNGKLLISSAAWLFESDIMSRQLHNSILEELNHSASSVLVKTKNDTMEYFSTYDYLRNSLDKPIGIVNLPYFDTQEVVTQDLSEFLWTLTQIYFLLFLAAGFVAYFLSNYITSSLQAIGLKLKNTKISEATPLLKWKFDDEIGTLVDEYNRMLKELERSAIKLAQTERESAWKEMAKQVAHEIKNPLTPMRLNVQYLEKSLKTEEPEKLKEFTSSMIGQIDTLSSIAEAFSRFANMPDLRMEPFPAKEIVKRVTALYPNYKISFECHDPDMQIMADKDQLVRVMNNLINNAIQAIPDETEPKIKVLLKRVGDNLQMSVSDNGTGIAEDQRDHIFEPRFTTKTKGMGLGLAIVKKIINGFKGEVWFESKVGKGTTFYIELPLKLEVEI